MEICEMAKQKVGRNDPCPCGSGKKFKKCCESKMIGGKFVAHKVEGTNLAAKITQAASGISSFFKNRTVSNISMSKIGKKPEEGFKPVGVEEYLEAKKEPTVPQEPLESLPEAAQEEKLQESPSEAESEEKSRKPEEEETP